MQDNRELRFGCWQGNQHQMEDAAFWVTIEPLRLCATVYLLTVPLAEHGQQVGRGTPEKRFFSKGSPTTRNSIWC